MPSKELESFNGHCPICRNDVTYTAYDSWYRDYLLCGACGSIPRERALALVLGELRPDWKKLRIHESSPAKRGISTVLKKQCAHYVPTQFFPGKPTGKKVRGFRNENLEQMTFGDESFDIFISLDVMEHVNDPVAVFRETARTLVKGGVCIFTTPTYKHLINTQQRAHYKADGTIDFLGFEPEYHGNPISDAGSLVTYHFGYDLPGLIMEWSGLDTRVYRFSDRRHGILGEFTEVYACFKH